MSILITLSALFIILIVFSIFISCSLRVQLRQIEELTKTSKEKWEAEKGIIMSLARK